jgi:hypothetical protein
MAASEELGMEQIVVTSPPKHGGPRLDDHAIPVPGKSAIGLARENSHAFVLRSERMTHFQGSVDRRIVGKQKLELAESLAKDRLNGVCQIGNTVEHR